MWLFFKQGICVWLLCYAMAVSAQEQDIFEDLSIKFVTISQEGEPTVVTHPGNHRTMGLFLYRQDRFRQLSICNDGVFDVWINGQLSQVDLECLKLDYSDLFAPERADTAYISVHAQGTFQEISAELYYESLEPIAIVNPVGERKVVANRDFLILITVVMMAILGFAQLLLPGYFRLGLFAGSMDKLKVGESPVREWGFGRVFELCSIAFAAGFAVWYLTSFRNAETEFRESLSYLLRSSGLILMALLLKYFAIRGVSQLHGIRFLAQQHYAEFIKLTLLSTLILVAFFLGKYWLGFYSDGNLSVVWKYYFLLVQIVFLIYFFLKVHRNTPVKKLSIFSYLCSTEILGAFLIALIFTR